MTTDQEQTCEERIPAQLASRLSTIGALFERMDGDDDTDREDALQTLQEFPAGVEARTTFKIILSGGGPADWLSVECTGDTPNYEPRDGGEYYEPVRIVYVFQDWFDGAERVLEGDEFEAAERFARSVVPELAE